jgi:hypothetical protein
MATAPTPEWSPLIHREHYDSLVAWIASPAPRKPPAVFLYGPPGVGKTTLAHRAVTAAGLRPVECNASQFRHKAAMSELIEPLLHSANVTDFFRPEGHRALGVILDEIDGMSAGERGGLSELVRILKDYKGPNAIICISNEWVEKRYQPMMRLALCRQVSPPDLASCASWLGHDPAALEPLWVRHRGDLRKLLQWDGAPTTSDDSNEITRSFTVHDLVMQLLGGELDIQEELHLDNNDLNLAGLHLHETLPGWIQDNYNGAEHGWRIYCDCLSSIATSDRQDYYTFFHQHWSLFPLSFQSKLQAVNHRLFTADRPTREGKSWKFQYTAVLARQSWLFNQFKYLGELRDLLEKVGGPLRDGGLEMALWVASLINKDPLAHSHLLTGGAKERISRWLNTLSVPVIPPCPIGGSAGRTKTATSAPLLTITLEAPVIPAPAPKRKGPGSAPRRPPVVKK